jgi:hypothetical protein
VTFRNTQSRPKLNTSIKRVPKETELTIANCKIVADKIKRDIFEPAFTFKKTIFLCGKDINDKSSIRYRIAQALTNSFWYSGNYDLIYPEDIFDELLYSSTSTDLLSLENLLADSVDAVVVIPESAGSFAELGAFANNEKLREKMICVIDVKYKRDKSFINQGPVKLVKSVNKDAVVYIEENKIGTALSSKIDSFADFERDPEVDKLVSAIRKMKKSSIKNKITLLQLDRFLLPTIFLLEPIEKSVLVNIVGFAIEDEKNSYNSTSTALTILTKKRYIQASVIGYTLTKLGINEFFSYRKKNSRYKQQDKTIAIDDLRIEILNLKYRNKKMKV